MPCQGPSPSEVRYAEKLQRAARLLVYVLERRSKPVSEKAIAYSHSGSWPSYDFTPELCAEMQEVAANPNVLEWLVYDAHDPTARDLADWWEEHQRQDKERLLREGTSFQGIELGGSSLRGSHNDRL